MASYYGGEETLDPKQEWDNCLQLGYSVDWLKTVNSYHCPLGPAPGHGRFLMTRENLNNLDLNRSYDAGFSETNGTRIVVKNLLFLQALAVVPGGKNDPKSSFWVEVKDRRHLARMTVINRAYNVRDQFGDYKSASLNGGSAWNWETMTRDIWDTCGKLGNYPGLPHVPDAPPENWDFYGGNAYTALNAVLARLECALKVNPLTDVCTIVRIATTDRTTERLNSDHDVSRVHDYYPLENTRARIPRLVRVHFPALRDELDQAGGSPYYTVDVSDSGAGAGRNVEAGTTVRLFDELGAIYTANQLENADELAARAAERASDFFRKIKQSKRSNTYTGALPFQPGPQVKEVRWRDSGTIGGVTTRVINYAGIASEDYSPLTGGGSPSGPGGPPGPPGLDGFSGFDGRDGRNGRDGFGTTINNYYTTQGLSKYESYFRRVDPADYDGHWYFAGHPQGISNNTTHLWPPDVLYAMPFLGTRSGSRLSSLAIYGSTTAPEAHVARIGIYSNDTDKNLKPQNKLFGSEEITLPGADGFCIETPNLTLFPGVLYWFVALLGSPGLMVRMKGMDPRYCWPILGWPNTWADASVQYGWIAAFAYDELPEVFPDTLIPMPFDVLNPFESVPMIGCKFDQ